MDYNELYEEVLKLPEQLRNMMVVDLLADEKVSYDIVSAGYIEYIKNLKEKQSTEYDQLGRHVINLFVGKKGERDKNIAKCISFMRENGRVNLGGTLEKKLKKMEEE